MTYTPCDAAGCRESVPFDGANLCPQHRERVEAGEEIPRRAPWSPSGQPEWQNEHDRRRGYAPGQRGHL